MNPLPPSGSASRAPRLGVVLLHGKLGDALERHTGLDGLALRLHAAGHAIALPSMPWAHTSWLTIDRDVPSSLALIDRSAASLRAHGAERIVLVGHRLGADVALAYAVSRNGIAGLVMAAPDHRPALRAERNPSVRRALEQARALVAEGRGDDHLLGSDDTTGASLVLSTSAAIYLSWMDPQGLAEISVQAPRLPPSTPLLMVIGRHDPFHELAEREVYRPAARHPYSRYLPVGGGLAPHAAAADIQDWIEGLPR
jgi:pimeloyl-ACP methyl ester carboxylesterase